MATYWQCLGNQPVGWSCGLGVQIGREKFFSNTLDLLGALY